MSEVPLREQRPPHAACSKSSLPPRLRCPPPPASPAGIPRVQHPTPRGGKEELWSLQAYLPSQTCPSPHSSPAPLPAHSLSEKLPPLLPHQRAVLQGDRLHGAIGDWRVETKEAGCLEQCHGPITSSTFLPLKPASVTTGHGYTSCRVPS